MRGSFLLYILFTLSALVFGLLPTAAAANRDVCHSCTYTSVQEAIEASQSGDTVRIAAGSYGGASISRSQHWTITLEGGYTDSFTTRNGETILEGFVQISGINVGTANIDRLTIRNSSTQGIISTTPSTDISITNCKIYNNASYGIYLYASGNALISGNEIYANGDYGGIGILRGIPGGTTAIITDNYIHDHDCDYCTGISISQATSTDLIDGNIVTANKTGISISVASNSAQPALQRNVIGDSETTGIYIVGGAANIVRNSVYGSGQRGLLYQSSGSGTLLNNVFSYNTTYGVHYVGGNGSPTIKHNIFFANPYGLYFSGNSSGFGLTSIVPTTVSYNTFFQGSMIHYAADVRSLNDETPGSYGDINGPAWSTANMILDPLFVDAATHDYRLSNTSFLIDEGDPNDSPSIEPTPNGGRVNQGLAGGSIDAETSPLPPQISAISAQQDEGTVAIQLDTNSSVAVWWISLEYFDGNAWQSISAEDISGSTYQRGYQSGRISSGSGQGLVWNTAAAVLGGSPRSVQVRAIIAHGPNQHSATSASFSVNFGATPTPTTAPTTTPTASPSPSVSPTPANTASPTPSVTQSPIPTAINTPVPLSVRVLRRQMKLGQPLDLQYQITGSEKEPILLKAEIRYSGKIRVLRSRLVTPGIATLSFGKKNLPRGNLRHCATISALSFGRSPKHCAALVVK